MKNRNLSRSLVLVLALVPATLVFGQTMSVQNSTSSSAACTTFELVPTVTTPVTKSIASNATIDTGLPSNASTLLSLELKQANADVAGTPLYLTGVLKAQLSSTACNEAIPPCLVLTPDTTSDPHGVAEANMFLAARNPKREFCLKGNLSTRDKKHYFTLENGLVVQLMGNLKTVPDAGSTCLCGAYATPPEPLKTIAFSVRHRCEEKAAVPKKP
ncbi:MAG: hypothetical protein JOZ54_14230 [Acidobacteria bacterium]|nr:hypothetical protein [Acidobacteriota bacterium]